MNDDDRVPTARVRHPGLLSTLTMKPDDAARADLPVFLVGCQVLFVFMTRHPFDTIVSLEAWARGAYTLEDPDIRRHVDAHGVGRVSWAMYWNEVNGRLLAFAARHAPRCLVFHYEDLVRQPDDTLSVVERAMYSNAGGVTWAAGTNATGTPIP